MILENEKYYIEIKIDDTYSVDSTDNHYYDFVCNPRHYHRGDFIKTFSIKINSESNESLIALIGCYYSYVEDCAILDNDILTVLQDDLITQINVKDVAVMRFVKLDCFGCNFAIYKI